jgi:hypothetical protein
LFRRKPPSAPMAGGMVVCGGRRRCAGSRDVRAALTYRRLSRLQRATGAAGLTALNLLQQPDETVSTKCNYHDNIIYINWFLTRAINDPETRMKTRIFATNIFAEIFLKIPC